MTLALLLVLTMDVPHPGYPMGHDIWWEYPPNVNWPVPQTPNWSAGPEKREDDLYW